MEENFYRNISFNYDRPNDVPEKVIKTCIVEFYRSEFQSKKQFGIHEESYKGNFGFDRFEKDICPHVWMDGESDYIILENVEPHQEVIEMKRIYPCPFLSIWPPDVEGNKDNKKNKVILYAKAKKVYKGKSDGSFKVKFKSSKPEIKIFGNEEYTKEMTIDGALIPLQIECMKPFGAEDLSTDFLISACEITASIEDEIKEEGEKAVGKLIIIPNRYIYYTDLVPVIIRVKRKNEKTGNDDYLNEYPKYIEQFCDMELIPFLREQSFNQALVHFRYRKPSELEKKSIKVDKKDSTTEKKDIKEEKYVRIFEIYEEEMPLTMKSLFGRILSGNENQKAEFMANTEQLYQKKILGIDAALEEQKARDESQVDKKLRDYIKIFVKNCGLSSDTQKNHKNHKVTLAKKDEKVKQALEDYGKAVKKYDELMSEKKAKTELDKRHKIHLFFFADIEKTQSINSAVQDAYVPAFSPPEKGTAYIFTSCLKQDLKKQLVTHEIGHAFGLRHPFFDDNSVNEKKVITTNPPNKAYYENLLKIEMQKLKDLNKQIENFDLPTGDDQLGVNYYVIKRYDEHRDTLKHPKDYNNFVGYINQILLLEAEPVSENIKPGNKEERKQLKDKKNELIQNQQNQQDRVTLLQNYIYQMASSKQDISYSENLERSKSLENFMDYELDFQEKKNPDFMYWMFNYPQWRKIQGTIYIEPINASKDKKIEDNNKI